MADEKDKNTCFNWSSFAICRYRRYTLSYICQWIYKEEVKERISDYSLRMEAYDKSQEQDLERTNNTEKSHELEWLYEQMVQYNRKLFENGAVHLTQTSLPVGGINTNAVFAAHRGYRTATMFRDIEKLEIGDEISVTNFYNTLTYRVVEIAVILPTDIERILSQEGRDLVTLITCHPYPYNYHMYVVYCERVEEEPAESIEGK